MRREDHQEKLDLSIYAGELIEAYREALLMLADEEGLDKSRTQGKQQGDRPEKREGRQGDSPADGTKG